MTPTTLTAAPASPASQTRLVLSVFKLRIAALIMVTALGGLATSPGAAALSLVEVITLALAVLVASAAAGGFNQYVEAASDRLMPRTRNRAFASGALQATPRWLLLFGGLLAAAVGVAWLVLNGAAAFYIFLGAFTYAVVYTLILKRRSPTNIVFGGLAGSFAVLAGAAAVDPGLTAQPLLLALALFLWTPPHFWSLAIANQNEYAAAGVPMLPVVVGNEHAARIVHGSAVLLVIVSLLPLAIGAGLAHAVAALVGGLHFVRKTHALALAPTRKTALAAFFASMVQLSVLLAGVSIDAALR